MDSALTQAFTDYKRFHGIDFLPFQVEDGPFPKQEEERKIKEPKTDKKPKKIHKRESEREFGLEGRPLDSPIVRAISDFLGLSPDAAQQDEKLLGELVLMAAERVNSEDHYKIMRFIKKSLRENRSGHFGKNPHRFLYRLWRM